MYAKHSINSIERRQTGMSNGESKEKTMTEATAVIPGPMAGMGAALLKKSGAASPFLREGQKMETQNNGRKN
jgi:hypothetical protein